MFGNGSEDFLIVALVTGIHEPLAEGEAYLRRVLSSYATYCNEVRTHLALRKETPTGRTAQRSGKSSPSRSCAVCITIMPG